MAAPCQSLTTMRVWPEREVTARRERPSGGAFDEEGVADGVLAQAECLTCGSRDVADA